MTSAACPLQGYTRIQEFRKRDGSYGAWLHGIVAPGEFGGDVLGVWEGQGWWGQSQLLWEGK